MSTATFKKPALKAPSTQPGNAQTVSADQLVLVTDLGHPLYDERVNLPVNEWLVASILAHGVMESVLVRRNGTKYEVINGRQRVKAVIEANKRMKAKIRVPISIRQDEDVEAVGVMIATNELRTADTPVVKARKAKRMMAMGAEPPEVAQAFGMSPSALKNLMCILDCDKSVQTMIDEGKVPVSGAGRISRLPRDQQITALNELIATGGATKNRVRAKVKAVVAATKSGKPEQVAALAPGRSTVRSVMAAYPEVAADLAGLVSPWHLLRWVLTGEGAETVAPGPGDCETLAAWLKENT